MRGKDVMRVFECRDRDWLMSEEAFSIYSQCMYRATYDDYKTQMDDHLNAGYVKIFVCEYQGEKAAVMVVMLSDHITEIIGIAVADNYHHRGIGKLLIQSVIESEELKELKAQTDDDSIGFYRKCGFSDEKIVIEYPDGETVRYNCVRNK